MNDKELKFVQFKTAKQLNPEIGQLIIFHHNNSSKSSVFICTSETLMLCLRGEYLHKNYRMMDLIGFDYQFQLV